MNMNYEYEYGDKLEMLDSPAECGGLGNYVSFESDVWFLNLWLKKKNAAIPKGRTNLYTTWNNYEKNY